jgi:hypothetical protein
MVQRYEVDFDFGFRRGIFRSPNFELRKQDLLCQYFRNSRCRRKIYIRVRDGGGILFCASAIKKDTADSPAEGNAIVKKIIFAT